MIIRPSEIQQVIEIKQNDTARLLYDTLTLGGQSINLTNATVSINLYNPVTETNTQRSASIVVAASGSVQYQLVSADVSSTGSFLSEWQVIFSNGSELTIPTVGYNLIRIVDDLDS